MNREVQAIVNDTDFNGYIVVDLNRVLDKTTCPNRAVSIALEHSRIDDEGLAQSIKVYSIGTMGKYASVPGERVVWEFNWKGGLRELMS